MREKLAQAVYWIGYVERGAKDWPRNATPQTPETAWEKCGKVQREFNLCQVDAILDAMMEPSEAMLDAGRLHVSALTVAERKTLVRGFWHDMLRAAKEG